MLPLACLSNKFSLTKPSCLTVMSLSANHKASLINSWALVIIKEISWDSHSHSAVKQQLVSVGKKESQVSVASLRGARMLRLREV